MAWTPFLRKGYYSYAKKRRERRTLNEGGPPPQDDDADAYFARLSAPLPTAHANAVSRFFLNAKANGYYSKFEAFHLRVGATAVDRGLNLIENAKNQTVTGTIALIGDLGIQGDGSTGYYLGWGAPNSWTKATQNSITYGVVTIEVGDEQQGDLGRPSGTDSMFVYTATGNPPTLSARLNSSSGDTWPVSGSLGHKAVVRSDANTVTAYDGGVAIGAPKTRASTTPTSSSRSNLRNGTVYNSSVKGVEYLASGLTAQEMADLDADLDTLLSAFGWSLPTIVEHSLSLSQSDQLPDGAYASTPGIGAACTGLARDPADGTWLIGNHLAPGVTRLSADRTTVVAEYVLGAGTLVSLSASGRSGQGVAVNPANSDFFFVAKNPGDETQTWIVHCSSDGTLVNSFTISGANGVAFFGGFLYILATSGTVLICDPADGSIEDSFRISTSAADHHSITAEGFLLATSDTAPTVRVYDLDNAYNTPVEVARVNLETCPEPEGIFYFDGALHVCDDSGTHLNTKTTNTIQVYEGASVIFP